MNIRRRFRSGNMETSWVRQLSFFRLIFESVVQIVSLKDVRQHFYQMQITVFNWFRSDSFEKHLSQFKCLRFVGRGGLPQRRPTT